MLLIITAANGDGAKRPTFVSLLLLPISGRVPLVDYERILMMVIQRGGLIETTFVKCACTPDNKKVCCWRARRGKSLMYSAGQNNVVKDYVIKTATHATFDHVFFPAQYI